MTTVLMLSAAHPHGDVRIVAKEGAALAEAGFRVLHLAPGTPPVPMLHGVELLGHAGPGRGWRARRPHATIRPCGSGC